MGYTSSLFDQMEAVKRRMQAPLIPPSNAFQLPQQGLPQDATLAPPLAPPPQNPSLPVAAPPIDPNAGHAHRKGVVGLLSHAIGADRITPELAALLTPDQQKRATPGLAASLFGFVAQGRTPKAIATGRANEMLALENVKTKRDQQARRVALMQKWTPIVLAARTPQERFEAQAGYASELATIAGPESLGTVPNFLNAIKPTVEQGEQPRNIDPLSPEGIRARLEFEQGKPKPSTELTPYQRESLRLQELRLRLSQQGASGGAKAPRPPTEAQEKSHIFYNLMATSAPEIDSLIAGGNVRPDMVTLALRSGVLDFAANRLLNDDEQKLIRAARDFTAGVLRKESGAAIKNDEILNTFQRYIPLSGEGDAVANAKKAARANYMRTMERSALPALNYYRVMEGAVPMEDPDHPEATGTMVPVSKTGKPHARY